MASFQEHRGASCQAFSRPWPSTGTSVLPHSAVKGVTGPVQSQCGREVDTVWKQGRCGFWISFLQTRHLIRAGQGQRVH